MKHSPVISVLLPVRNGALYIDEALRSIFAQTEQDFEVIAVDDGSSDETPARLKEWAARDPRVVIIKLSGVGPALALNAAISEARGEYLARMDADDVSHPGRFEAQIHLLVRQRDVGACGTWVRTFGVAGRHTWRHPATDFGIRARLVFDSPLAHPSVMIRRDAVKDMNPIYRQEFGRAEDYDLWERLGKTCKLANVPRVLLNYRMHTNQVTVTANAASVAGAALVRARILRNWWPTATDRDLQLHEQMCTRALPATMEALAEMEAWLLRMGEYHQHHAFVPEQVWRETLATKWWEVCRDSQAIGAKMLVRFIKSPLQRPTAIPARRWLRLLAETACHACKNRGAQ